MSDGLEIVIYDDELDRAGKWKAEVDVQTGDRARTRILTKAEAHQTVRDLAQRRKGLREGTRDFRDFNGSPIDEADILIVDFDLLGFELESQILTGEEIARLARAYSRAGIIVVVNQYGSNKFDLTLRQGFASHADLNIGGDQVANPGLWKFPFKGYRPWIWPLLTKAIRDFEQRSSEVAQVLDRPVFEFLEFPKFKSALPANLSRHSLSLLQGTVEGEDGHPIERITFREFVCDSGTYVSEKEAKALRRHDQIVARLASAYVQKWLEYAVLPSQDVLIDVPHFLERLPWMLDGNPADLSRWNASINLDEPQGLKREALKYCFKRSAWLSRPVLWWTRVVDEDAIGAPAGWNPANVPDIVFREDVSNFGLRSESRQFVADVEGLADTRYVSDPDKIAAEHRATDPRHVDYSPSVRFAM